VRNSPGPIPLCLFHKSQQQISLQSSHVLIGPSTSPRPEGLGRKWSASSTDVRRVTWSMSCWLVRSCSNSGVGGGALPEAEGRTLGKAQSEYGPKRIQKWLPWQSTLLFALAGSGSARVSVGWEAWDRQPVSSVAPGRPPRRLRPCWFSWSSR
jgi:hypothetical protein